MCAGVESEPPPFCGRVPSRGEVNRGEAQVSGLRGGAGARAGEGDSVAETESLFDGSWCTYLENIAQRSQNCLLPFP